jgi:tetratricopeptide (TPR) repeat protein
MSENPGDLDEQQARLVERLRAAGGAPVTFDELRDIGIENPALLCYELAAVGLPITRTASPAEGMPALSVRLEPELQPPPVAERTSDPRPAREQSTTLRLPARPVAAVTAQARRPMGRARDIAEQLLGLSPGLLAERRVRPPVLMAMLALAAAFGAVIAIALGDLPPNRAGRAPISAGTTRALAGSSHKEKPLRAAPGAGRAQPQPAAPGPPRVGSALIATPVSPAAAAELEAQGHQLLARGSYASAIPALASALRASGQSLAGCMEPASEACLTFAYALYDLGRALRLDGHHAEAVSVLSERLRIDNQRPTVAHELELARSARA